MATVGKQYEELIEGVLTKGSQCQFRERRDPKVSMRSSVTGTVICPEHTCTAAYWCNNLESPVHFETAIELLAPAPEASTLSTLDLTLFWSCRSNKRWPKEVQYSICQL